MARHKPEVKKHFFAVAAWLILASGCEAVPAPNDWRSPPPRLNVVATAKAPSKAMTQVEKLARKDRPPLASDVSCEKISLLKALPDMVPARAILADPSGYEFVAQLGDRVGAEGGLLSSVKKKKVVVSMLKWQGKGRPITSDLEIIEMLDEAEWK